MHRSVQIHPRFFGVKLKERLTQRLIAEVEGSFAGKYGFVVAVLQVIQPIPKGELQEGTGFAVFPLNYQAVVFRPFKGEVMDSVVTQVTQHGFFASSGPLNVFVSYHLLPEDMRFVGNAWRSKGDDDDVIDKGKAVRLRILGLKIEVNEVSATGSIKDPYLGPLDA